MLKLHLSCALTLVVGLAIACGGGGEDDGPEPTTNLDRVRAVSMLIDEDTIPQGWERQTLAGDYGDSPLDECTSAFTPVPAKAKSGAFSPDISSHVIQHSFVFPTEADAAAALLTVEERGDCILALYESGGADTSATTYSNPQLEALETTPYGDGASSFRVSVDGQGGGIIQVATLHQDYLYVQVGRALIVMIATGFEPFGEEDLDEITEIAVTRAEQELA
jgi:hypothetical protein